MPTELWFLQRLFGTQFPALPDADWLAWSKRSWDQTPDGLLQRCDTRLGNTLNDFDPDQPIPALWEQFDALAPVPIMVIGGAVRSAVLRNCHDDDAAPHRS